MLCFFFNDTATTEIYTLSLHDALPICGEQRVEVDTGAQAHRLEQVDEVLGDDVAARSGGVGAATEAGLDRKSTRLNSSHANISYAVFCLKKKNLYIRLTL